MRSKIKFDGKHYVKNKLIFNMLHSQNKVFLICMRNHVCSFFPALHYNSFDGCTYTGKTKYKKQTSIFFYLCCLHHFIIDIISFTYILGTVKYFICKLEIKIKTSYAFKLFKSTINRPTFVIPLPHVRKISHNS